MSIAEKYRIIQKLGGQKRRKFGEIYLVENKQNSAKAVMKVVRKTNSSRLQETRLRSEANFNFQTPGLPERLDFNDTENEVILIRPFIDGNTIDNYWKNLKRRERIPFIITFLEKLVPIFNTMNEQEIVHCDIKPSNFLISDTQDFDVHLIDFGLAIQKNKKEERNTLFPLGYAAPELLLNQLDIVDQRTDMYSLGILIWRLYVGNLPLTHPNPSIFTNLQLTHPLPENSSVPKGVYKILSKMTQKHQFNVPPNQLSKDEVRKLLMNGMDNRHANLLDIIEDFRSIKKQSFVTRLYPFSSPN